MEKKYMYNVLSDLINSYLSSFMDNKDLVLQLIEKASPTDVVEYEDELINETYFTIYHMNEKYCGISDEELIYLRECLDGKQKFSKVERDKITNKN